jgi:hypothetical protein
MMRLLPGASSSKANFLIPPAALCIVQPCYHCPFADTKLGPRLPMGRLGQPKLSYTSRSIPIIWVDFKYPSPRAIRNSILASDNGYLRWCFGYHNFTSKLTVSNLRTIVAPVRVTVSSPDSPKPSSRETESKERTTGFSK